MKKSIFCIIVLVYVSSCCVQRKCSYFNAVNNTRDSIIYNIKDSIKWIDSTLAVPVPEGESYNITQDTCSHIETTIAESSAWITDGELHHTIRNKRDKFIPFIIKLPQYLHRETKYVFRTVTHTIEVNVLTSWQHFFVIMGKMLSAIIIGLLLYIIIRILLRAF